MRTRSRATLTAACLTVVAGCATQTTTAPHTTTQHTTPRSPSTMQTSATVPNATTFTTAPLRHRLRVELNAPVPAVWAVVGQHDRMPDYSAGISSVRLEQGSDGSRTRVCQFRGPDGSAAGPVGREQIRWEAANVGYATTAEPGNPFGLSNDLSLITVTATATGTTFTWDQHYDSGDLAVMRASFDDAFADMASRLIARFGGRVLERYIDGAR